MELTIRGKDIYRLSKTKTQMIKCLNQEIEYILNLPEEATIENSGDDYITFYVDPKDKDDRKHYRSLGFTRSEV